MVVAGQGQRDVSGLSCPTEQPREHERGGDIPPGKKKKAFTDLTTFIRGLLPNVNKQRQPGALLAAVPFVIWGFCLKGRLLCLQPLSSNMSESEEKISVKHKKLPYRRADRDLCYLNVLCCFET